MPCRIQAAFLSGDTKSVAVWVHMLGAVDWANVFTNHTCCGHGLTCVGALVHLPAFAESLVCSQDQVDLACAQLDVLRQWVPHMGRVPFEYRDLVWPWHWSWEWLTRAIKGYLRTFSNDGDRHPFRHSRSSVRAKCFALLHDMAETHACAAVCEDLVCGVTLECLQAEDCRTLYNEVFALLTHAVVTYGATDKLVMMPFVLDHAAAYTVVDTVAYFLCTVASCVPHTVMANARYATAVLAILVRKSKQDTWSAMVLQTAQAVLKNWTAAPADVRVLLEDIVHEPAQSLEAAVEAWHL